MIARSAAPARHLRRGSVVWCRSKTWLVYDVAGETVLAFPVRVSGRRRRRDEVAVTSVSDQLLTRIAGAPCIRIAGHIELPVADLEYAGEFGGRTMCALSVALMKLEAARRDEAKWADDRRHQGRANAERCALR